MFYIYVHTYITLIWTWKTETNPYWFFRNQLSCANTATLKPLIFSIFLIGTWREISQTLATFLCLIVGRVSNSSGALVDFHKSRKKI